MGLGLPANLVLKQLEQLTARGATRTVYVDAKLFYAGAGDERNTNDDL